MSHCRCSFCITTQTFSDSIFRKIFNIKMYDCIWQVSCCTFWYTLLRKPKQHCNRHSMKSCKNQYHWETSQTLFIYQTFICFVIAKRWNQWNSFCRLSKINATSRCLEKSTHYLLFFSLGNGPATRAVWLSRYNTETTSAIERIQ